MPSVRYTCRYEHRIRERNCKWWLSPAWTRYVRRDGGPVGGGRDVRVGGEVRSIQCVVLLAVEAAQPYPVQPSSTSSRTNCSDPGGLPGPTVQTTCLTAHWTPSTPPGFLKVKLQFKNHDCERRSNTFVAYLRISTVLLFWDITQAIYHNSTCFFAFLSTESQKHYGIFFIEQPVTSWSKQVIH